MALLHSNLGERTVYTVAGLAKAQGMPVKVYTDPAGTIAANLAAYNPLDVDTPGPAIAGAALVVDAYSNRPAFWDLDDRPVLYITVNGGPLEPIYPDAQPQIAALLARIEALEAGGGLGPVSAFTANPGTPGVVTADDTAQGIDYADGVLTVNDVLAAGVTYADGVLTVTTA